MNVYREKDSDPFGPVRIHPYERSTYADNVAYYDFRKHPDLIRENLEDYKPWEQYEAIETFYQLLEWLNGETSVFETNDCAFGGPTSNISTNVSNAKLQCSGRLMTFYRNLASNTDAATVNSFLSAMQFYLQQVDPDFAGGSIGLCFEDAAFSSINNAIGKELVAQFWAFGDTDEMVFDNLNRLFLNLRHAFVRVNEHVLEAMKWPG